MLKTNTVSGLSNITPYGRHAMVSVRMYTGTKSGEFIVIGAGKWARSAWPLAKNAQTAYFPAIKRGGLLSRNLVSGSSAVSGTTKGEARCTGNLIGVSTDSVFMQGFARILGDAFGTVLAQAQIAGYAFVGGDSISFADVQAYLKGYSDLFGDILGAAIVDGDITGIVNMISSVSCASSVGGTVDANAFLKGSSSPTGPLTAEMVAQAVWSTVLAGFVSDGSAGKIVYDFSTSSSNQALLDAINDALKTKVFIALR